MFERKSSLWNSVLAHLIRNNELESALESYYLIVSNAPIYFLRLPHNTLR